jgi:transcriptional regulator with XRE-family HTH domain
VTGDSKQFDRELGELLELHRMAKGLTRAELAGQMGLTPAQIERYETGRNRLSVMRYWTAMSILDQDPSRVLDQLQTRLSLGQKPAIEMGIPGSKFMSSNRGRQIVNTLAMCDQPEVINALADLIFAIGVHSKARASRLDSSRGTTDADTDAR